MMQAQYDSVAKAADIGVGVAAGGAYGALHATNEVVQILAGLVAILAGVVTAVFHIKRIRALKKAQEERDE
jgi:hypothetical protein